MTRDEMVATLSRYWRPSLQRSKGLASDDSVQIEAFFGCTLPPAFRMFRAFLPRYDFEGDHLALEEMQAVYEDEPVLHTHDFLPFYSVGNGDYLCLSLSACPESPVLYVAHDEESVTVVASSFEALLNDPEWWS